MGGTKRKIEIKNIESKASREVTFSKRRKGLYSKVSELCLLSGAKMAILATPVSSKSNFSFYSFGHSSVDSVVSAFLANQPPLEEEENNEDKIMACGKGLGLGFWWEDESVAKSDDPEKLRDAIESISKMLNNLKQLRSDAVESQRDRKKLKTKQKKDVNETLNLPSTSSASLCIQGDSPLNFEGFFENNEGKNQILATSSDNIINNNNDLHGTYEDGVDVTKTLYLPSTSSASLCFQGDPSANFEGFVENNEGKNQILVTSYDNINNDLHGNFDGCNNQELDLDDLKTNSESLHEMNLEIDNVSVVTKNQENLCCDYHEDVEDGGALITNRDLDGEEEELDLDQLIDFEMNSENLWMDLEMDDVSTQYMCADSEDGRAMVREYLDLDNLQFSDYFHDLPSITAL